MRKLALWGEQVAGSEINFEWPADIEMIWPTVKLESLEFKSSASVLSSVRCVLSNGITSPVFEKEGTIHENNETVRLDSSTTVRHVQAFDEEANTISRLYFLDDENQVLSNYNPYNLRQRGPVLKLREEETLVGVYGVLGKKDYFTSFGFIVKAWESVSRAE